MNQQHPGRVTNPGFQFMPIKKKPVFVLYRKRADSIEAVSSKTNYEELERSTDKIYLEHKAFKLSNEHPAWWCFVGVPKDNEK